MKWTTRPPEKPGWYFWRIEDNMRVYHISERGKTGRMGYGYEKGSACLVVTPQEGEEWAGPIEEPTEEEADA